MISVSKWKFFRVRDELELITPLLESLPEEPPPFGLYERIESEIFRPKRLRWWAWRTVSPVLLSGACGAAIGAICLAAFTYQLPQSACPPVTVAMLADEPGSIAVRVETIECGRYLRAYRQPGGGLPDGALELWLIADGSVPQSLGLLNAKGSRTILPLERTVMRGDVLAVSREPSGGSRADGPSGPVLASARVEGR